MPPDASLFKVVGRAAIPDPWNLLNRKNQIHGMRIAEPTKPQSGILQVQVRYFDPEHSTCFGKWSTSRQPGVYVSQQA